MLHRCCQSDAVFLLDIGSSNGGGELPKDEAIIKQIVVVVEWERRGAVDCQLWIFGRSHHGNDHDVGNEKQQSNGGMKQSTKNCQWILSLFPLMQTLSNGTIL